MDLAAAVVTASRTRLRPILMTSLATVVGLMPMALGLGTGSETNAPLARAVVAGLGLVALSVTTTLWAWLLAFELMSLGLERAGLTGAKNRNASSIHYYSSICFLISFSLHEMLIAGPYSTGLFTLGMGLRLGVVVQVVQHE